MIEPIKLLVLIISPKTKYERIAVKIIPQKSIGVRIVKSAFFIAKNIAKELNIKITPIRISKNISTKFSGFCQSMIANGKEKRAEKAARKKSCLMADSVLLNFFIIKSITDHIIIAAKIKNSMG